MWKETFPLEEDFPRRAGGVTQTQHIQDSSPRGQYRKPNEDFHLSAERTRELSYSCGDLPLILGIRDFPH
ncbi:Hypothetical predicted protein [Paramuricea clavata]|uniref:Uncharacterized protein n=1 Tax=Paramuricea clavata TaxID=317549 RepID=A0A7D9JKW0_PARCT|nr:Hypothetical predicted protein [Paramuricea clavata]